MQPSDKHHLSKDIENLLAHNEQDSLTFGTILDELKDKGFGIALVLLALPSALPVPAAGYSVPFGLFCILLALQMMLGRSEPALPDRVRSFELKSKLIYRMLGGLKKFFKMTEYLIRPRLKQANSKLGRFFLALVVLAMGVLMCIPIPGTNTFPAMVIFLIGVGLTEEDGLVCLAATLLGLLSIAFYVFILLFGAELIGDAWNQLKAFMDG